MARLNTTISATDPPKGGRGPLTKNNRPGENEKSNTDTSSKKGRKRDGRLSQNKDKGFARFEIYEDTADHEVSLSEEDGEKSPTRTEIGTDDGGEITSTSIANGQHPRPKSHSLRLSNSNITATLKSTDSGVSKDLEEEEDATRESQIDSDQEEIDSRNSFLDDEADEASEEKSQPALDGELDQQSGRQSRLEDSFGLPNSVGRFQRRSKYSNVSRYQDVGLSSGEESLDRVELSDSEDGSLNGFIVADDEDISYHESMDELPNSDEQEEEESSPKPRRRRLIRGRRPQIAESSKESDVETLERAIPVISLDDRDNEQVDKAEARELEERGQTGSPNLQTPPASPLNASRLSPSKFRHKIPKSPHRESSEDFWKQDVIAKWADDNSPWKQKIQDPEFERLVADFGDDDSPVSSSSPKVGSFSGVKSKTPSKTALKKTMIAEKKEARQRREAFNSKKHGLAQDFFETLDNAVTGGKVQKLTKETGGVKITWSKTLSTTAGRCQWRSQITKLGSGPNEARGTLHYATIELAEKVIDCEERLLRTFAHEYCHLTNYMISNVHDQPHGSSFQKWGRKCEEAMEGHPVYGGKIEVTTKHSYVIDFKYIWKCVDCGVEYGRHSKSIKPETVRCGPCGGRLEQIKPPPRKSSPRKLPQKSSVTPVGEIISKMASVSIVQGHTGQIVEEAGCEL